MERKKIGEDDVEYVDVYYLDDDERRVTVSFESYLIGLANRKYTFDNIDRLYHFVQYKCLSTAINCLLQML